MGRNVSLYLHKATHSRIAFHMQGSPGINYGRYWQEFGDGPGRRRFDWAEALEDFRRAYPWYECWVQWHAINNDTGQVLGEAEHAKVVETEVVG